jgi:hypothetical protein
MPTHAMSSKAVAQCDDHLQGFSNMMERAGREKALFG